MKNFIILFALLLLYGQAGAQTATINPGTVKFQPVSVKLSYLTMEQLNSLAYEMKAKPDATVKLIGHGTSDKRGQQLSWDRVNAVKEYLIQKRGIAESRVVFIYSEKGDESTVDYITAGPGAPPLTVPAPRSTSYSTPRKNAP